MNRFKRVLLSLCLGASEWIAAWSYVSPTQINALAPLDEGIGRASSGDGASRFAIPRLLYIQRCYIAGLVLDSGSSFEDLARAGSLGCAAQSRAAKVGDTILLYGTGLRTHDHPAQSVHGGQRRVPARA